MSLTRREFVASTASGLSLFPLIAKVSTHSASLHSMPGIGRLRHIHLELPTGPYTRAELSESISNLAAALQLPTPTCMTSLGARLHAEKYPSEFALTIVYTGDLRLVVRATRANHGPVEITLRGDQGANTFSFPALSC